MEYKINNFNLSDINFNDTFTLPNYLESSVINQNIKNLLIGPNIINFKFKNESKINLEENKKIINSMSRLLLHNFGIKEQTLILNSTSNSSSKSFIKKIFKELQTLIDEKIKIDNRQEIFQSFIFFDFLKFFTALKDEFDDEVSLCDYIMSFTYEEGVMKFNMIETFQNNSEIVYEKSDGINNLNIFYMMLYNLPVESLKSYLICDKTKEYFNIFNEQVEVENFIKRYVFINQFGLLKNKNKFEEFAKSDSNVEKIKKEFEFYKSLYTNYLQVKQILGIDEENERKIFEVFFAIILISELDLVKDYLNLTQNILEKIKNHSNNNINENLNLIRNVLTVDQKFKISSKVRSFDQRNNEKFNILQKIAMNLNITEEKIIYILLLENINNKNPNINFDNYYKIKNFFIKNIYDVFIDKIKFIFQNYDSNKDKNLNLKENNNNRMNIIISRSNLVYNSVYLKSVLTITNNEEINVDKNIKEVILSNYQQELKNYLYLRNSLNITSSIKEFTWPNINLNDNYNNRIMKENYNFPQIIELYDNGLLKIIEENSNLNISQFKQKFTKSFYKKNYIEMIENNKLKIKHTFGTFLYDLEQFNKEISSSIKLYKSIEESIHTFLEYKNNKNQIESTIKLLKRLTNVVVYNSYLIKVNKFKISEVLEDFKLENIHQFYNNFFNYIINMKDIRENIVKYKKLLPLLQLDDIHLFKNVIAKKIRISQFDYNIENGYVYCRNNFNRVMDSNKNISNLIFKYNHKMFYYLIVKKVNQSEFSYLRFAINAVRCFVKLNNIYQEKKVFKNVKNLITDLIVEHHKIDETSLVKEINPFIFDFANDSLSQTLPKLYANLQNLKKIWKHFINDVLYYKNNFVSSFLTDIIIKERLFVFKSLLLLFSKNYEFSNLEILRKNGILHFIFTQNIVNEVLSLMNEFHSNFKEYLEVNNFDVNFDYNSEGNDSIDTIVKRRISFLNDKRYSSQNLLNNVKNSSINNLNNNLNDNLNSPEIRQSDKNLDLNIKNGKDFSFKNVTKFNNNTNNNIIIDNNNVRTFTLGNFDHLIKDNKLEKFVNNRYILTQENMNEQNKKSNSSRAHLNLNNFIIKQDEPLYQNNNEKVNLKRLSESYFIPIQIENKEDNISNISFISKNEMNENSFYEKSHLERKNDDILNFSLNSNKDFISKKPSNLDLNKNINEFEKVSSNETNKYSSQQNEKVSQVEYNSQSFLSNKDFKYKKINSLKFLNVNKEDDSFNNLNENSNKSNSFIISSENQIFIKSSIEIKQNLENEIISTKDKEGINENENIYVKKKMKILQKEEEIEDPTVTNKTYYSDAVNKPKIQYLNLNQLKEFDNQMEILKKEISNLELIDAITESTAKLCFDTKTEKLGNSKLLQSEINSDNFYLEIQNLLLEASKNLNEELI